MTIQQRFQQANGILEKADLLFDEATCRTAVFANKDINRPKPITADYVGIHVPNRYVFGYGMDASGMWRNLGAIYALADK